MDVDAAKARVLDRIDERDAVALAQLMVRTPSVFPEEKDVARLLADRYDGYGLELTMDEVEAGRCNVLGALAGAGERPRLLIEGHIDVVAPGDESNWIGGPWSGRIEDGRLYGRGAHDMKAGIAAAAIAAKAIKASGVRLKGDLQVAGFVDEENLMIGVRHYVKSGRARELGAAITLEPTFGMSIGTAFCGRSRADVIFRGMPGHTGIHPRSGIGSNAIHMAWRLIKAIEERLPPHQSNDLYGESHWQAVAITGGNPFEATIPARCTVRIDARQVPGHRSESIWSYVEALIAEFRREDPRIDAVVEPVKDYETAAWSTPVNADIVMVVRDAFRAVTGHEAPLNQIPMVPPGSRFPLKVSTDLHHIAPLGVPCLNIGPRGSNAHMANEFVEVGDIAALARILALTAVDYLGVAV